MPVPVDEPLLAELWSRFKAGEEKAFDQLAELRYRVLFNYATRFTKDRDFIKDCIQDLFLELWERHERLVDTPYVTIYLIKSLRNNLVRKLRQEKTWGETPNEWNEETLTDETTIERELIAAELLTEKEQNIRRAIGQLPTRQKEILFRQSAVNAGRIIQQSVSKWR